ncbi:unnamed protein product [Dicrocoelium dendriticum]|nr:unnamed protein product [Dicrocoelium dendriticum]
MRSSPISNNALPNIHLENFEDQRFENCRYVLTSPRSLEACAKLNIRPVELLYKCKEEFLEEFKDLPPQKVLELYTKHEHNRMQKLVRARAERKKLADNGVFALQTSTADPIRVDVAANFPTGGFEQKASSREINRRSASLRVPTRNSSASRSLFEAYERLMKKLPPNEAKRLKLAHMRYLQYASLAPPQVTGGSLSITGMRTVPMRKQSCERPVDNHSSQALKQDRNPIRRCTSNVSVVKDSGFWLRRHSVANDRAEELNRLENSLAERHQKVEELLEKNNAQRRNYLHTSHLERDRRLQQAQERRKTLESMLENYRREIQEAREVSQQKAKERVLRKLNEDIQRKTQERILREQHIRENARQVQQKQEEWRKMAEAAQKQKDSYVQKLLEEREAKIQQSRCLAQASEQLREEMLRMYNLDSFDKKAQRVAILNEIGLGNSN